MMHRYFIALLLLTTILAIAGCGGPKGVINRVRELQPKAEQREHEIEELSRPGQGG